MTEITNLKLSQLFIEFPSASPHNLKFVEHRNPILIEDNPLVFNFVMYKNLISSFILIYYIIILCLANVEDGEVFGIFVLV